MALTAFEHVTLVDGTGAEPVENACVITEGAVIRDIISDCYSATDARHIDCRGQFLLPGLIDAHVHVAAVSDDIINQDHMLPVSLVALLAARRLEIMLSCGFTTVRDAGGADDGLRSALEQRVIRGPRLQISGRPLSQTGGHGDHRARSEGSLGTELREVGMTSRVVDGVDNVRAACREEIRRGADWIKVFASGGAMSPADKIDSTQYSLAELRAICEEAAASNVDVMAHALTAKSVQNCVAAGVRSIEHGNMIDEASAALLAEHDGYLVPTWLAYQYSFENADRLGRPADIKEKLGTAGEKAWHSIEIAKAAGVQIGSGSDLLGDSVSLMGQEIALQAQAQGSLDAIRSATLVNARLMRLGDRIGSVEAGKLADLIVVDGDPVENPALLGDMNKIVIVVKGGEIAKEARA
jgi:imidazolonepropionase-like amidohydrolase